MVENGYVTRDEADEAKKEPLTVNPRVVSPNTIASGYFAEEVRREIAERYGEKKLYEGGLSVRTTLDPKMQAMARKALVDGLVRYDEARGWRGAQQKIDLVGREWGLALAEVPALGDVQPWRLAVVLEVAGGQARVPADRLQPDPRLSGRDLEHDREPPGLDVAERRHLGEGQAPFAPGELELLLRRRASRGPRRSGRGRRRAPCGPSPASSDRAWCAPTGRPRRASSRRSARRSRAGPPRRSSRRRWCSGRSRAG